ncbi:hypothetical protein BJ166DRAFT_537235 [Pestalotiopsis sp. NC0098]|nr:hypothetical protein BJ166DRAFT_537235 [Pestalotiopsis sp. NC0098]
MDRASTYARAAAQDHRGLKDSKTSDIASRLAIWQHTPQRRHKGRCVSDAENRCTRNIVQIFKGVYSNNKMLLTSVKAAMEEVGKRMLATYFQTKKTRTKHCTCHRLSCVELLGFLGCLISGVFPLSPGPTFGIVCSRRILSVLPFGPSPAFSLLFRSLISGILPLGPGPTSVYSCIVDIALCSNSLLCTICISPIRPSPAWFQRTWRVH